MHNLTYETTRTSVRANREFLPRHPSKKQNIIITASQSKNNSVFLIVVHFEIGYIPSSPFISFKHNMTFTKLYFCLIGGIALLQLTPNAAFTTQHVLLGTSSSHTSSPLGPLFALHSPGRSSSRSGKERSKRQERVSQLVQTELGKILHSGLIKGDVDYLEDDLRQRISIVSVDVSPDLRQARISTSVRGDPSEERNVAIDKRRAYSWLVSNTKNIRHTLAQKMSHMKTSPNLSFVQVDVAAAVDVMYLIDKVSNGYTRENVGDFGGDDDSLPRGYVEGMDFDEEFDEEEWEEEDDGFFDNDNDDEEDFDINDIEDLV